MSGIFSRKRTVDDIVSDPSFLAFAWHLAGACKVASVVLNKKDDPEVQEIGRVLDALSSRFDSKGLTAYEIKTASEDSTSTAD